MRKNLVIIILLMYLSACSADSRYDNGINKLPFNASQVDSIKTYYKFFNDIFSRQAQQQNLPLNHVGYGAYDDGYFFKNCLNEDGQTYIFSDECNFNNFVTKVECDSLDSGIKYLWKLGIVASDYSSPMQEYLLVMHSDRYHYLGSRFLYLIDKAEADVLKISSFEIVDTVNGLALLRHKK